MRKYIILFCATVLLSSCALKEDYMPVGFQTKDELSLYRPHYLYFGSKLTSDEWSNFFRRFPEYWKSKQTADLLFSINIENDPLLTTYAFRWNQLENKKQWDDATTSRLDNGIVKTGDNIYRIIYSLKPPDRIIWDNDFEILVYDSGQAYIINEGFLAETKNCEGCYVEWNNDIQDSEKERGMTTEQVLKTLNLSRPSY